MCGVWSTQPDGWKILSHLADWPIYKLCVAFFGSCRHWPTCSNYNFCSPAQAFDFIVRWLAMSYPSLVHRVKHKDKYFLLGSPLCSTWGFHRSSTCPFPGITKHLSLPAALAPPVSLSSWPVFEAAAGAPPLGSLLRKAPHCVDETRPQSAPNSRCEVYKRLPFSPDIHKKDSPHTPPLPPLKLNLSICFPSLNHFFVPSTFSALPTHGHIMTLMFRSFTGYFYIMNNKKLKKSKCHLNFTSSTSSFQHLWYHSSLSRTH